MAFSVNKQTILGNLGKDPELRYTQAGKPVCRLSVATSERWGRGDDQKESTTWHRVVLFDKIAEVASRLLRKGDKVYIEGRTETNKYTDKQGIERWSTQVVGREIVFLTTSGQDSQAPAGDRYTRGGGGGDGYQGQGQGQGQGSDGADDIPCADDEDIPF